MMVVSEKRTMIIGGGVVSVFVLLFALLSGGGDPTSTKMGSYTVQAVFNRIDGLYPGDEVRLGGVRIGTVTGDALTKNFQAVLSLTIDDRVKLPNDTSAAIHTDGLFGSKYVVLEPGGDEEYLAEGGRIMFTQDALIVSELLEMIIAQGKRRTKEFATFKTQIKQAQEILARQKGGE